MMLIFLSLLGATIVAQAKPILLGVVDRPALQSTSYSAENAAHCFSSNFSITISANTSMLHVDVSNQTVVTEIFQETQQINSTIAMDSTVGPSNISNMPFQIEGTLCIPANKTAWQVKTVQVLTYGTGLDKSYWDIAPNYSYVDAAAKAGYATFAYNRLGVGGSEHPDPIQTVQASTDVEILHGVIQSLRSGAICNHTFSEIIGVGHSYGSIIQVIENARYPEDVNATVLTSFIANLDNLALTVFANNPAIANENNPTRWGNLPNGYVVHDTAISIQLPFFRFPFFEQDIFENQVNSKGEYTIGQQLTLGGVFMPAPAFTRPVFIIVGQRDFPFCRGDCNDPPGQVEASIPALYPNANNASETYIVPNSGHYINAHVEAQDEFNRINMFLQKNGF